jgi:hypothetical protein
MTPIAGQEDIDFEGILVGRVDGHYLLYAAKIVQGEERSFSLENVVEIPAARVWWLERLVSV